VDHTSPPSGSGLRPADALAAPRTGCRLLFPVNTEVCHVEAFASFCLPGAILVGRSDTASPLPKLISTTRRWDVPAFKELLEVFILIDGTEHVAYFDVWFPLGKAALATRAVSSGTRCMGSGCIDITLFPPRAGLSGLLLEYATPPRNKLTVSHVDTTKVLQARSTDTCDVRPQLSCLS